jgi:hypothetical protein
MILNVIVTLQKKKISKLPLSVQFQRARRLKEVHVLSRIMFHISQPQKIQCCSLNGKVTFTFWMVNIFHLNQKFANCISQKVILLTSDPRLK